MQRALLTVVALWLPLLPFFFIMRHVIKERSGVYAPADAPASACPVRVLRCSVPCDSPDTRAGGVAGQRRMAAARHRRRA